MTTSIDPALISRLSGEFAALGTQMGVLGRDLELLRTQVAAGSVAASGVSAPVSAGVVDESARGPQPGAVPMAPQAPMPPPPAPQTMPAGGAGAPTTGQVPGGAPGYVPRFTPGPVAGQPNWAGASGGMPVAGQPNWAGGLRECLRQAGPIGLRGCLRQVSRRPEFRAGRCPRWVRYRPVCVRRCGGDLLCHIPRGGSRKG